MNEQQLLRAVGAAKPEYLEKSEEKPVRGRSPWGKWAIAACLCLAVGTVFGVFLRGAKGGDAIGREPAAAESASGSGSDTKASTFMSYAGPVFPLTLREETAELTAERALTLDFAPYVPREEAYTDENGESHTRTVQSNAVLVTDAYTLTNSSDRDVTVTALYPFVSSIYQLGDLRPELTVNGETVQTEIQIGAYSGGFGPAASVGAEAQERWNPRYYHNWEEYKALLSDGSYQQSAFDALPALDETVYVYTVTAKGEPMESPATVAFVPERDAEKTKILSYNFNGFDYNERTGAERHSFFVSQRGIHVLAVLGEDISGYTVQGYRDGGCDAGEELDGLSADVMREEMTLSRFLHLVASDMQKNDPYYGASGEIVTSEDEEALFYRAAVEFLMNYGALSDDPAERYSSWGGSLDTLFGDARSFDRVCYAVFELTIPAGESVTVTAQLRKEASYDFYGIGDGWQRVKGYDLVTQLGSTLCFKQQTASVETRGAVQIVEQNFGFDVENGVTTVTLDPDTEHYYLNVISLVEE